MGSSLYAQSDTTKIQTTGGAQIMVDYGKLLTFPSDFESKWEIGIAYQFSSRFQPNFSFGMGTLEPDAAIENGAYRSEGSYWRAGINYLLPLDNTNRLFVGIKYAQTAFDDSGTYQIESELWPLFEGEFSRTGHSADWFELILGSEKIFSNGHIILGGQTGVRFINERSEAEFIDIYSIPGYGLATDSSTPFLNLYVKYQF